MSVEKLRDVVQRLVYADGNLSVADVDKIFSEGVVGYNIDKDEAGAIEGLLYSINQRQTVSASSEMTRKLRDFIIGRNPYVAKSDPLRETGIDGLKFMAIGATAGALVGLKTGASAGAAVGSIEPGAGTAVGAGAGAGVGMFVGFLAGLFNGLGLILYDEFRD